MKMREKKRPSKKRSTNPSKKAPFSPPSTQWINEIIHYPIVKTKSRQFNIRIPDGLYHMIQAEAAKRRVPVSDLVRASLIFQTVPGALLEILKQNSDSHLSIKELQILKDYEHLLRKLLDDLKLVKYQNGGEGAELPKPEVLDMEWINNVITLRATQVVKEMLAEMRKNQTMK